MSAEPAEGGRSRQQPLSRRPTAARRRAALRRSEVIRLAISRRQRLVVVDFNVWAFALAATLGSASEGKYPLGKTGRWAAWPGLDFVSLANAMREAGFEGPELTAQHGDRLGWAMDDFIEHVGVARHSGISGSVLGRVVQLTAEERILCSIRTIDAIDETVDERRERARSGKAERDRERQRAKRLGQHRTREEYEAGSAARLRPWEAEGVSKSTYYKRRRSGSATSAEMATCATDLSRDVSEEVASSATDLSLTPVRPVVNRATDLSRDASGDALAGRTGMSLHPCNNIGEATHSSEGGERLDHAAGAAAPPPPSSGPTR